MLVMEGPWKTSRVAPKAKGLGFLLARAEARAVPWVFACNGTVDSGESNLYLS